MTKQEMLTKALNIMEVIVQEIAKIVEEAPTAPAKAIEEVLEKVEEIVEAPQVALKKVVPAPKVIIKNGKQPPKKELEELNAKVEAIASKNDLLALVEETKEKGYQLAIYLDDGKAYPLIKIEYKPNLSRKCQNEIIYILMDEKEELLKDFVKDTTERAIKMKKHLIVKKAS